MKNIYLTFLVLIVSINFSFSQNGIIGNGFGADNWSTVDCFNESAGSSRIFVTSANGTGERYFRMVDCWDNQWNQWGPSSNSDTSLVYNTAYSSNDLIENNTAGAFYLNADSSNNYIFKTRQGNASSVGLIVFEVQGDIQTVSSVTNPPTTYGAGNDYSVTATLSGSLSSGQGVYLRYTNDSYNTTTVVEMTGAGTSYSANIPANINVADATISYYVFTSGNNLTILGDDADFYTINYNTNSGSNYSYVVDATAPVITVAGDNPATVELGATYTDAGATADGGETVTTSGTVDTSTVGTYTITYSATDAAGNTGTATRTVNVVDTTAPVITVIGDNPATVELGATYTDAGATADGGETVTSSGTVDTSTVGTYTITYTATDAAGNTGTATRTVNVVDTASISDFDLDDIDTIIYPNPAYDHIKINQHSKQITIYDLSGKLVQTHKGEFCSGYRFDIASLESGVYFVSIKTEKGKTTRKLLKK